jgi:hypothetical protein
MNRFRLFRFVKSRYLTNLLPVFIFLFSFNTANCQPQKKLQWIKQIGGKSWDISSGIVCNSKNHLFVTGNFIDTLKCDSKRISSSGNMDLFVARFDDKGKIEEINSAGGCGDDMIRCVSETSGEGILIGGVISDSASFGKQLAKGSGKRLFISEVDMNCNFKWISTISMLGEASLFLIDSDENGDIFFAGDYKGSLRSENIDLNSRGKKDIFLGRLDKTGKIVQLISIGGEEDDFPTGMAVDSSGKVLLTGNFGKSFKDDKINFNTGPKGTTTNTFIINLTRDLVIDWANFYYTQSYLVISSLKFDKYNSVYASGSFDMSLNFSDTILVSNGYTDAFLIKFQEDGKFIWAKSFGSWYYDNVSQVNIDNVGGVMIAGSLGGRARIDSINLEPEAENDNAFIIQFSDKGKAIWGDCLTSKGRNFSQGSHLDKKGNLYFTGSFKGEFEVEGTSFKSFGDQDIFLAKFHNCNELEAAILGEPSFCPGSETDLHVNKDYLNVVWNDSIYNTNRIYVQKPGLNWVRMFDKYGCLIEDTIEVQQNILPEFTLGSDTTITSVDSLILRAPTNYSNYIWQDNSTLPELCVKSVNHSAGMMDYWLSVTDSLSCTWTDTISVRFIKESDENIKVELKVYPNPAKDLFYWVMQADRINQLKAEIIDLNGRVLYQGINNNYSSGETIEVPIQDFPVGAYNFQISNRSTGKIYKSVRLIKK